MNKTRAVKNFVQFNVVFQNKNMFDDPRKINMYIWLEWLKKRIIVEFILGIRPYTQSGEHLTQQVFVN